MRVTAGDRVSVRGERWVVEEATAFADSTLLDLSSAGSSGAGRRCQILLPFDRPAPTARIPGIRAMTPRRWAGHLEALLSEQRIHGQLRSAQHAAIDILPFQLEPAIALIQGRASRFLLADEVGLGKTIQAALMLAELRRRGWCNRALILAPSGLRQQWADELQRRFQVRSAVIDASSLSILTASLPFDVNPWTIESVVITSIDFVKQPEVLRALASQIWDLVIVDEAHQAAVAPQRHEAVQAVATRARHVVLVTATPHAGDDRAFHALCGLGQFDPAESILLFRRTREQAGLPRTRRAHLLGVRPGSDAMDMHRRLEAYLAKLWQIGRDRGRQDAQLVAMVLAKRAFSCAHSLVRSLERRLAGLVVAIEASAQQVLPFEIDTDASDEAQMPQAPAFDHVDDERDVLQTLIEVARRAQRHDRKLHALERILRRVREPVIVFTEYRDTLDAITAAIGTCRKAATLHGGQTPQERLAAVAGFSSGAADLLLATDAGSEGLNLHATCRLVINLELPWNPIRLEQRIGRVDRIGQTRTVHAINLFAAGTAEGDVLARLQRRLARIRMSEIELAACIINRSEPAQRHSAEHTRTTVVEMRGSAEAEAQRMAMARTRVASHADLPEGAIPVTCLLRQRLRSVHGLRHCVVAFMRVRLVTLAGRLIEDTFVPVRVPFRNGARGKTRRDIRIAATAALATIHPHLVRMAREHAELRSKALETESAQWSLGAIARERHIARNATSLPGTLVQTGLFDTRAVTEHLDSQKRHDALQIESHTHANLREADTRISLRHDPDVALLVIAC